MKHYQVDEFVTTVNADPMDVAIDKKVSLLYDLCVLVNNHNTRDSREVALREVLSRYNSEHSLTTALHDVVVGKTALNTFLEQKGGETV
jgi:hypothetical protein